MQNAVFKDRGQNQDGVGLLTSILLRYSEVGSINYWRDQHALKFTFMILEHQEGPKIEGTLKSALEVYHSLEGQTMRFFDIAYRNEETIGKITVTRDVESMTQREVGLIVGLMKQHYQKKLICDEMYLPEDEQLFQEELIRHMLSSIKSHNMQESVVALREEGRILVFKS